MLLLAEITVELEASDFIDAAAHQEWFAAVFADIKAKYPKAAYGFRATKASAKRQGRCVVVPVKRGTGAVNNYVE